MNRLSRHAFVGLILSSVIFEFGCGASAKKPVEQLAPVTGRVTIQGTPHEGIQVIFTPQRDTKNSRGGTAVTDKDGKFEARNYQNLVGLPPGDYAVTFSWMQTQDGLPVDSSRPPIPGVTAVEKIAPLWNDPKKVSKHNFLQVSDGGKFDLEYKITTQK
ncbi:MULTISPECIES: carboxypeptidase-like regulatory domain-containing protein [unclassified Schlesneria]|uniref:carboxypeptidase-like regulatory domain-containing protein n=1 Tax=Schlesneria TaxID=656899 RepID=UPI0035A1ABD7